MNFLLRAILLLINLGTGCYFILANPLKFSDQTSTKLTFHIRPKAFLGMGLFFSQFLVYFLFSTLMFTPITQLVCNRSTNNISISNNNLITTQNTLTVLCKLTKNDWFGQEKSQVIVSELLEAKLETKIKTDSQAKPTKPNYTYEILLLNNTDTFPFTSVKYPKFKLEELQSIVLRINIFLTSPVEKNLSVKLDDSLVGYIYFIIAIFCGILALLITGAGLFITCDFEKEGNIIKISRYRWFGMLGKTVFQDSLNEIIDIKLEYNNTSESGLFYQVILVLESGVNILLTPNYSSKYINGDYIVRVTRDFLELKHKDSAR